MSDLTKALQNIRAFVLRHEKHEDAKIIIRDIDNIEEAIRNKPQGLVFERHKEPIEDLLLENTPVLSEDVGLMLDNGGEENWIIEGDNLACLNLLEKTHKGTIDLIYIDPPYNTGSSDMIYNNNYSCKKDSFKHSRWLSMMESRLLVAKRLLSRRGVVICAIDENESAPLRLLLEDVFGDSYTYTCITIVHNPRGIQGKDFSCTNEFAYFVIPKSEKIVCRRVLPEDEIKWNPLRNWGGESLRSNAKNCFYPIIIQHDQIIGFGDVSPDDKHPSRNEILSDGSVAVYPIDRNGVERKWRYARQSVESIRDHLKVKRTGDKYDIYFGNPYGSYKTVWQSPKYDANTYGTKLLRSLLPGCSFDFPKSLWTVYDCISAIVANNKDATVLDFFAGSGTTGHAVMQLNQDDGGNRKFILCNNNENNICRDVTYERIKRVIAKEDYKASLKYFKVDYLPRADHKKISAK